MVGAGAAAGYYLRESSRLLLLEIFGKREEEEIRMKFNRLNKLWGNSSAQDGIDREERCCSGQRCTTRLFPDSGNHIYIYT